MKKIRQRDTAPELAVRSLLTRLGVRYRVCPTSLPGRPDIANQSANWALFVHGCFWHGHEDCSLSRTPKTNTEFWIEKIRANRERDRRKERELRTLGFVVGVVWQCELKNEGALLKKLHRLTRKAKVSKK